MGYAESVEALKEYVIAECSRTGPEGARHCGVLDNCLFHIFGTAGQSGELGQLRWPLGDRISFVRRTGAFICECDTVGQPRLGHDEELNTGGQRVPDIYSTAVLL